MAILKAKEIRNLSPKELDKKLGELKLEISRERANISIGATVSSPGKIREMRKAIARIHTIRRQKESHE